ncbi:MAG: HD-GYP domain-containing protein, partial [Bdellovibrionales bacterium]
MADKYTPIRVASLRGDLKIPFDAYIFVAGKHILYCRKGSSFEGKRLERLKAKKLKKLFVKPEDEIPYRQYLEQSIDTAYNAKGPIEMRAEVIQGFQQSAAEEFMEDPLNEFS